MKLDNYSPNTGDFMYTHFQRKYRNPRARKPSGGIGILIRSCLFNDKTVSIVKSNDFVVWIRIKQIRGRDLFIGGVYIPPRDSTSMVSNFVDNNAFDIIQTDVINFSSRGDVAICGDFNARTGNMSDFVHVPGNEIEINTAVRLSYPADDFPFFARFSDDPKVNVYGRELIALCKSSQMRIMNGFFNDDKSTGQYTCCTPRGTSLIDYLICDLRFSQMLIDFKLIPLTTDSDHRPLSFTVCHHPIPSPDTIEMTESIITSPESYYKYVYNEENANGYLASFKSERCLRFLEDFNECVVCESVDASVENIYNFLESAISENYSKIYRKGPKNKFPKNLWFDCECKTYKRIVNDYSKSHDLKISSYREHYLLLKKKYKAVTQKKKRQYQNGIRTELNNFHSTNQNDYWKFWDSLKHKHNNSSVLSNKLTLQHFEEYFSSVQSPPDSSFSSFDISILNDARSYIAQYDFISTPTSHVFDFPITSAEVSTQIRRLKLKKAPGIDGIGNEFYKSAEIFLVSPLTTLFNLIWEKGIYPEKWSEGIIQPLHKKGSQDLADNYRKVTLMACMGKIFEGIINCRLECQSDELDINDPNQFGFCVNRRTTDNVFIIDTLVSHQKHLKKPLYATFVDFTKAFDFINRDLLYYKLLVAGFSSKICKIVMRMFSKSNARVRWEGQLGQKIESTHGVLQGGIVSPKLFNFFLADLVEYLDQNQGVSIDGNIYTHLVYADDLVLLSSSSAGMQILLNNLEIYCRKWHLIINSSKTKVMVFNAPRNFPNNDKFELDNYDLEIVDSYKYLGHVLCSARNIHCNMPQHVAIQAQRALYLLYNNIKSTVGYLPPNLALRMFDTHVLPVLEYNSGIWFNLKKIEEIEKIQLKFLKNVLGVRSQTSSLGILADTGRLPLLVRQHISAIKYLKRLNSNDSPILITKCFDIQKELHSLGLNCWYNRLITTLENYGINEIRNLDATQMTLFDKAHHNLFSDINNSDKYPKLRTYKLFKTETRIEPYLNLGLPKSIYCYIARFRLSSHNLKIELGRHKRPYIPPELRICDKCNLQQVEDEIHCLMTCPKWQNIRVSLITTASKEIDNFFVLSVGSQFQEIMCNKTDKVNLALGQYLRAALKIS